jgi:hypothetical protein
MDGELSWADGDSKSQTVSEEQRAKTKFTVRTKELRKALVVSRSRRAIVKKNHEVSKHCGRTDSRYSIGTVVAFFRLGHFGFTLLSHYSQKWPSRLWHLNCWWSKKFSKAMHSQDKRIYLDKVWIRFFILNNAPTGCWSYANDLRKTIEQAVFYLRVAT